MAIKAPISHYKFKSTANLTLNDVHFFRRDGEVIRFRKLGDIDTIIGDILSLDVTTAYQTLNALIRAALDPLEYDTSSTPQIDGLVVPELSGTLIATNLASNTVVKAGKGQAFILGDVPDWYKNNLQEFRCSNQGQETVDTAEHLLFGASNWDTDVTASPNDFITMRYVYLVNNGSAEVYAAVVPESGDITDPLVSSTQFDAKLTTTAPDAYLSVPPGYKVAITSAGSSSVRATEMVKAFS